MLQLTNFKCNYFLYITMSLLAIVTIGFSSELLNSPFYSMLCVALLIGGSYFCYLKVRAKSFKLFWRYVIAAFCMLTIERYIQIAEFSPIIGQLSVLSAWLFAVVAIEANPNTSEMPQSQFTARRVSGIIFCIAFFTYLVLIPKANSDVFVNENDKLSIFNGLISIVIAWRLLESWKASNARNWQIFYLGLTAACLLLGISCVSHLLDSNSTSISHSLTLTAILLFLSVICFTLKNKQDFAVKNYYFSTEPYLLIQLVVFIGVHLSLGSSNNLTNHLFNIESLFFIAWLLGTFVFLAYVVRKNRHIQRLEFQQQKQLKQSLHQKELEITQLSEALKFSEEKAIVASSSNAILTVSIQGTVLSVNPAAVQMFQYLENKLIGQSIARLFNEDDELHFFFQYQSNLFALQRKNNGISKESLCVRADGHEFPAQVEMQWAERQGLPLIAITFINLTARKLAEQQTLEQKDAFLANVSHEFRTPLTLINGIIDKFIERTSDKSEVEDLTTAKRNSLRLVRMVEQLLELSKLQESPQLNLTTYELAQLLQMPLDSFRQLCQQQTLEFTSEIPASLFIECDAEAFEKVIFNLLANAVKYTPKGGSISVIAHQDENEVLIDVIDTGVGINKSFQSVIFNRFERVQDASQQAQFGVGIGLSLVKELVKAHQWRINLISEPQKGSKFTLHIPLTTPVEQVKPTPTSVSQQEIASLLLEGKPSVPKLIKPESKRVVLLIEDNKDMQQHVQQLLDTQHHCITADDGESGIALAVEYIPDIIVCDIMLTGIDGFEVLSIIKQHEATSHIPVILLTARSDLESRLKGLDLKADEYLGKPFNRKELLSRIDSLIHNREQLKQVYVNKYMDSIQKQRKQTSHQNITSLTQPDTPEKSADDNFLEKLEHFVAQHYTNPQLEITEVAAHLAMSERQLQRKIRVLLGSTPNHYLKEFRLSKAKDALANNKPIGHIALDVGFSSQTYFGRCFKEKYNMTPKQYQASLEE